MALKTGRAEGSAHVTIDRVLCDACGCCVRVCAGDVLRLENGAVLIDTTRLFGCVGCAHCMLVCPTDAIAVHGRDTSPADVRELPPPETRADFDSLLALLLSRRSVRRFRSSEVGEEAIQRIVEAVSTAPMGLPPSDVEILVLRGRSRVQEFAGDIVDAIRRSQWFVSPLMTTLMRPFIGKEAAEMFRTFLRPLAHELPEKRAQGEDWLLYDAPLAMYFHTSPYSDPADPVIAATYAMLAAESLGLGSCMIGTVAPILKSYRKVAEKYGIPPKNQQGILVIFGYPSVTFRRAVKRRPGRVHVWAETGTAAREGRSPHSRFRDSPLRSE